MGCEQSVPVHGATTPREHRVAAQRIKEQQRRRRATKQYLNYNSVFNPSYAYVDPTPYHHTVMVAGGWGGGGDGGWLEEISEEGEEEAETVEADAVVETVDDSEGAAVTIPFNNIICNKLIK